MSTAAAAAGAGPARTNPVVEDLAKRLEAEKKANRVMMELGERPVTESAMQEAAPLIQAIHYDGIVESRAIERMCGYPPCTARLPEKDARGKYHIDLANRRVVDIDELKYFCSRMCFAASKHYLRQLSDVPVGLRGSMQLPPVEVVLTKTCLRETTQPVSANAGTPAVAPRRAAAQQDEPLADTAEPAMVVVQKADTSVVVVEKSVDPTKAVPPENADGASHWTIEGYDPLNPPDFSPDDLKPPAPSPTTTTTTTTTPRPPQQSAKEKDMWKMYEEAVAQVEALELEGEDEVPFVPPPAAPAAPAAAAAAGQSQQDKKSALKKPAKKPLPRKDDKHISEILLDVFGEWVTEASMQFLHEGQLHIVRGPELVAGVVMPPLAHNAQVIMRRDILLGHVEKALSGLLMALGLAKQTVMDDLTKLIHTLNVHNDTLNFKPFQWICIAFMLVNLISIRVPLIKEKLDQPSDKGMSKRLFWIDQIGLTKEEYVQVMRIFRVEP